MLIIILYVVLLLVMISTKHDLHLVAIGTTSMILVLSVVSFVGVSTTETFAQGTNATNATTAGAANATGASAAGSQTTVVMPLGSSDNQDNALHTATSGQSPNPDGKFDTSYVAANQQSKPVTVPTEPGQYPYFCTLHPFLTGTVVVQ
jgi:plastocyanin